MDIVNNSQENLFQKNELKFYENIHKGSDIYILGSGKSLDFIDKSFFDNKILIGINQVYKYIQCKYLLRKEHKFLNQVLKNSDDNTMIFISKGNCGAKYNDNKLLNFGQHPKVVLYPHLPNNRNVTQLPPDHHLVVSYSSITTGIHLAAYMGAKNIILVGHDGGSINNECNFSGYHTDKTMVQKNQNEYKNWLTKISSHTITLKKLLKTKYDCNVVSINPFINFNLEGNIFTP